MNDLTDKYSHASEGLIAVANGVADDQLSAPTPCSEYTVRELLNHLFYVTDLMEKGVAGEDMEMTDTPPDFMSPEQTWRNRFTQAIEKCGATFSNPAVLQGDPLLGLPRSQAALLPLFDFVIHSWDLARATGQEYHPYPPAVDLLDQLSKEVVPGGREFGVFAEAVEVPQDASEFARLLAFTGRDPHWRP
ncbi:TIGR03086 family metal-binding protein [Natronoglycomyces albus]|uniref:TIGR03086 family protein n=1 Tax=Natronoglycomyces albus TaxID=2811108 RepID=A0A895XNP8_9ACTN|nr:TIGR03086 family metal-binding protein [Natronoglycomyces albus]QSB05009.1 TIGR03086 family protein [Natronoglycomyces albus]